MRVMRGSVDLEYEADGALVRAGRHEVGSGKSGVEIVQSDFICEVGDGEPERKVRAVLLRK